MHPRKKELENLIKSYREHEPNLRYQIRTGATDIKLMMKFQEPNDFQYWKQVQIEYADPNNTIPDMDYETPPTRNKSEECSTEETPEQVNDTNVKEPEEGDIWEESRKRKERSPLQQEKKRMKQLYSPKNMTKRMKDYLNGTKLHPLDD